MKNLFAVLIMVAGFGLSNASFAEKLVLSDLQFFKELGVPIIQSHPRLSMAIGDISGVSEERLHQAAHSLGRCGGYENLSNDLKIMSFNIESELKNLESKIQKDQSYKKSFNPIVLKKRSDVADLAALVSSENLRSSVTWMEAMGTRYHKASDPNRPVVELERRLKDLIKGSQVPYLIETIAHSGTRQKSLKLTFPGASEPDKKIILGAHFDSIAGWGFGDAPGADDNASGSSNLIEVVRILSQENVRPQKTLEFYWYAGEEGGLIGSGEIAKTYKRQNQSVVAVMQLDMTLYPGDGPFVLGSVTDYTTPWVRELLSQINQTYFGYQMNEFECGYGCSDHASWYRQGYSTVAPFEAQMRTMNRDIHTSRDRIKPSYNFEHSAAFSKLALAFALELDQLDSSLIK